MLNQFDKLSTEVKEGQVLQKYWLDNLRKSSSNLENLVKKEIEGKHRFSDIFNNQNSETSQTFRSNVDPLHSESNLLFQKRILTESLRSKRSPRNSVYAKKKQVHNFHFLSPDLRQLRSSTSQNISDNKPSSYKCSNDSKHLNSVNSSAKRRNLQPVNNLKQYSSGGSHSSHRAFAEEGIPRRSHNCSLNSIKSNSKYKFSLGTSKQNKKQSVGAETSQQIKLRDIQIQRNKQKKNLNSVNIYNSRLSASNSGYQAESLDYKEESERPQTINQVRNGNNIYSLSNNLRCPQDIQYTNSFENGAYSNNQSFQEPNSRSHQRNETHREQRESANANKKQNKLSIQTDDYAFSRKSSEDFKVEPVVNHHHQKSQNKRQTHNTNSTNSQKEHSESSENPYQSTAKFVKNQNLKAYQSFLKQTQRQDDNDYNGVFQNNESHSYSITPSNHTNEYQNKHMQYNADGYKIPQVLIPDGENRISFKTRNKRKKLSSKNKNDTDNKDERKIYSNRVLADKFNRSKRHNTNTFVRKSNVHNNLQSPTINSSKIGYVSSPNNSNRRKFLEISRKFQK